MISDFLRKNESKFIDWREYIATPPPKYLCKPPRKIDIKQRGLATGRVIIVRRR